MRRPAWLLLMTGLAAGGCADLAFTRQVECGRLDEAACRAILDAGIPELRTDERPLLAVAVDYDCPPEAACPIGFGAVVAGRFLDGHVTTVFVGAGADWEPGRPFRWLRVRHDFVPSHVARLLPGA